MNDKDQYLLSFKAANTSEHCLTLSRPQWSWQWVFVNCYDVYKWPWNGFVVVAKGSATKVEDAVSIDLPEPGDGVSFDMAVTPHAARQLVISAKRIDMNDGGYVQVLEPEGEGWTVLAEAPVGDGENMVIPFIPDYGNIRIAFWGRLRGLFYTICDQKQEWVAEEQLVTICDEDKDKYRWGFNGIEKVNEIAGIGNHYQALYGDYSSRTGFRWNLDPKATPGISPYAMFRGNPIWFNDILLDSAWAINNKWDDKMAKKYETDAPKIIKELEKNGEKFTCDDLALTTVMTFAKNNNLPFKWHTGFGTFDASSDDYNDFTTFKHDVLLHSGAPDFQNSNNTFSIGKNLLSSGDLILNDHEANTNYFWQKSNADVAHHVQIITHVTKEWNVRINVHRFNLTIKQGNFNQRGRYLGSDDPSNSRYLGVPIQTGFYDVMNNYYINETTGAQMPNFSWKNNNKLEFKTFNFLQWNK